MSKHRALTGWALSGSLALAGLALGCSGGKFGPAQSGSAGDHALTGAQAPSFELPAQVGAKQVSLADGAGKVMIVDFWATWCDPCKESFPHYQKLVDKYGGELVVVGLSVDDDPKGIAAFAKSTGVKFPLAWDEGQSVSQAYQPPTMPTSYVIDKNGIVRYVHVGFHSGDEAKIDEQVASLMK